MPESWNWASDHIASFSVKIVDANVLIHAVSDDSAHHQRAKSWLDGALVSTEQIGFSWSVMTAFIRITTNGRIFPTPLTPGDAFSIVEAWLGQPAAVVISPGSGHLSVLRGLSESVGTAGNLINDAHVAALAIEHRAVVVTFDRDFGRFPDVRWESPIASGFEDE